MNCPYCGVAVSAQDTVCSNCFWDLRQESVAPFKTTVTMAQQNLEPESELNDDFGGAPIAPPPPSPRPPREAKPPTPTPDSPKKSKPLPQPAAAKPREEIVAKPSDDTAIAFRPRLRRPMAILKIYDDDSKDAEVVRIRTMEVTFGRDEGDIRIPHERMMSGKHATITCKYIDRHYRWYLTDLDSTNGTFLKVQSGKIQPSAEFMAGSFRYRLVTIQQGEPEDEDTTVDSGEMPQRTLGWKKVTSSDMSRAEASLVRVTPSGDGEPIALRDRENIIGSDPHQATLVIGDDPMLSSRHMRIYRDDHRRWFVEDLDSRNGVWLAIKQQELDKSAQFQLGEQKFGIRFP